MLSDDRRPTAMFTASDTQALGVIAAAREIGLHVPDDLSVVGYDDIEAADYVGLTTVRQQLFESGRLGAEILLARDRQLDRTNRRWRGSTPSSWSERPRRVRRRAVGEDDGRSSRLLRGTDLGGGGSWSASTSPAPGSPFGARLGARRCVWIVAACAAPGAETSPPASAAEPSASAAAAIRQRRRERRRRPRPIAGPIRSSSTPTSRPASTCRSSCPRSSPSSSRT